MSRVIPMPLRHRAARLSALLAEYDVTCVTGGAALDALEGAGWDDLVLSQEGADPLRLMAWLRARGVEGTHAATPRALLLHREGELVAAAALEVARRRGLTLVRLLGQTETWFHPTPPARDAAARRALYAAIGLQVGDLVVIDGIATADGTAQAACEVLAPTHVVSRTTWRLDVSRPPRALRKRRKEARRAHRRAADAGSGIVTAWTDRWDDIAPRVAGLLDFHRVHFPSDDVNLLSGDASRRENESAIRALGSQGRARLVEVHDTEGRLLAWDLAFVEGAGAVSYAGTFDRSRTELRMLGWIAMLEMIDNLAAEGVQTIDFGSGWAPYKALVADPVPMLRISSPLSLRGVVALRANAVLKGGVAVAKGLTARARGVLSRRAARTPGG